MDRSQENSLITILIPDIEGYGERNEFLNRELGLSLKKEENRSFRPLPHNSVIYCHDIDHWSNRLSKTKSDSISVIFSANEYYDIEKWKKLDNYASVKVAFCEYLPVDVSGFPLSWLVNCLSKNRDAMYEKAFWSSLFEASKSARKLKQMRIKTPLITLPLGYTNRFVSELKILGLVREDAKSILDSNLGSDFGKKNRISFYGQKGSWYRRRMVDQMEKVAKARVIRYPSWGGFDDLAPYTEYTKSILESEFVLCPPGNKSSQSFRYYETISLGAVPIISELSMQDWTIHGYWPREFAWEKLDYFEIWLELQSLSPNEVLELNKKMRKYVLGHLKKVRNILSEVTN